MRRGGATRSATVEGNADRLVVGAGVHDLVILKSSQSAFEGFLRDEYTTLAATRDRLLATSLTATWIYGDADVEFGTLWRAVRATLLDEAGRAKRPAKARREHRETARTTAG